MLVCFVSVIKKKFVFRRYHIVSGIVLATTTKEKPAIYEVVAVGSKVDAVKAGEKVVVSKHTGTDITLDKVDYKFVKQEELLAVVED